jgi:hypothetical protein
MLDDEAITHLSLIRVRPSIRTSHHPTLIKLQRAPNLILERLAPYTLPTLASPRRVSALYHERLDVAMEYGIIIRAGCAVGQEIFGGARGRFAEDFDLV